MNQEMGPGRIKVKVTVTSEVVIDEDDLESVRTQRWDDVLSHLHQEGISIRTTVVQIEPKPETTQAKKKGKK